MIIEKVCIVCGKSFLAANPLYCICDDECRAKRKTVYKKRYEKTHAEAIREQRRKRNEKYREQHKKKYHCTTVATYEEVMAIVQALVGIVNNINVTDCESEEDEDNNGDNN